MTRKAVVVFFFFKKKKKIKKTMSSNKALGVLASCCGFTLLAVGD